MNDYDDLSEVVSISPAGQGRKRQTVPVARCVAKQARHSASGGGKITGQARRDVY